MKRQNRWMAAAAVLLAGILGSPAAGAPAAGEPTGFFAFYERNRQEGVPNYITEDFLVRAYLLTLEAAVTEFEEKLASPALRELLPRLRTQLGTATEAERVAQGYLAVLEALLAGREAEAGDPVGVAAELARVRAAEGLAESPLLRQRLDYSQFRVRGKYTGSAELGRYFQTVRLAGTALFPLLESRATGMSAEAADALTGAAVLISRAIAEDAQAAELYERAIEPLAYVFGPADAMTVAQYAGRAVPSAEGGGWGGLRRELFAEGVRPRVWGAYVDGTQLEPGVGVADVLAGWQLLPARWTPASAAFQELVHDRVGRYAGAAGTKPFTLGAAGGAPVKAFPTVWELGALLGSEVARQRLELAGETAYAGYPEAFGRAAEALAAPTGLAAEHLELLRAWLAGGSARATAERRLNTALGFWVLQRHGAAAYAKQSYTVAGRALPAPDERKAAWLEPAEELYRGLARVARRAAQSLQSRRLEGYAKLADRCADLAGRALGAEDVRFLNGLDRSLGTWSRGPDAPVAIDYHTDANSDQAVQAALGWPQAARQERGRGALFTVYEFKRPVAERLDDERWARSLREGPRPASRRDGAPPAGASGPRPLVEFDGGAQAGAAQAQRVQAWTNEFGMEFVRIPAGGFRLGSTAAEADSDEGPVREVRISQPFYLGKYEVTQEEWEAVMGTNPSAFEECGPRCPVEQVSWRDAQEFVARLNGQEAEREFRYRLPTEAEWEYAARAGSAADPSGEADAVAWHAGNSGGRPHSVGGKRANAWGLHDMLGNVREWVQDWYGAYPSGAVTDPRGPGTGSYRVIRGGGWNFAAAISRASNRYAVAPGKRHDYLGFRLLREVR